MLLIVCKFVYIVQFYWRGTGNTVCQNDELLHSIINSLDVSDGNHSSELKSLARELAAILLPAITSLIVNSFENSPKYNVLKSNMRVAKYDNDKLEQYTRRENIRIFNLETESDQPLVDGVTEFLNEGRCNRLSRDHC